MQTVAQLYDEKNRLVKGAEDIVQRAKDADDRPLTEDENKAIDKTLARVAAIGPEIETVKATEESRLKVAELTRSLDEKPPIAGDSATSGHRTMPTGSHPMPHQARSDVRISTVPRYSKLEAFKGPNAEEKAHRCGMWLQASCFKNDHAQRWCHEHGVEWRALSTGSNAAGGALVPEEFAQTIIDLREEYGVFRQNVRIQPMGSDVMTIPRVTGQLAATFTAENGALTESEPTFNNVTLTAKKTGVLTRMSTEIAEDSVINMADYLAKDFAWAFAFQEDTIGFIGDGTAAHGSIQGIARKIEAETTFVSYVLATAATDTHAEIILTELIDVMSAIPAFARTNAKWYCSLFAWDVGIQRLAAAAGGNTIQTLQGDLQRSFLGHPVVISQVLAGSGTQNLTHLLLFGDLSQAATLGDRRGFTVATSGERYFEQDQVALKATARFDIAVHDIGDATTGGPVAALIGRT